jgi:hypothetical protein
MGGTVGAKQGTDQRGNAMTTILTVARSATKKLTRHILLAGLLTLAAVAAGCGVEAAYDCHGVCDRYQSCYDSSYDTGSCASRCRDNASSESGYANKADNCHECMDDNSCAASTFGCATLCVGIVP